MESAGHNTAMESPEKPEITWLAITTSAGKFIVKTGMRRSAILERHSAGDVLPVIELYDYGCPIQQIPTGPNPGDIGIGKMHFSSRMDSTLYPCQAYVSLAGAMLYFLDDLNTSDGMQYKSFIQSAYRAAIEAAKVRAAKSSGIITDLPKEGNFDFGRIRS